jgi:hypothetical protein
MGALPAKGVALATAERGAVDETGRSHAGANSFAIV